MHRRVVRLAFLKSMLMSVEESACDLPGLVIVATRLRLAGLDQSIGAFKFSVGACFREHGQVKLRFHKAPILFPSSSYLNFAANVLVLLCYLIDVSSGFRMRST